MYLMLDVPNITRRDSLIDPYCVPATRTQKVALKLAWARRNFKKRRNGGDIFSQLKESLLWREGMTHSFSNSNDFDSTLS